LSFFNELKRRNVFKVGVAYLISAWLLIQVADILLDNIGAPPWVLQAIFVLLGIGLFIALVVAWAFELTPEGIKKEKDVDRTQSIAPHTGRKLNIAIIALLVMGMAYFFWESRFSGSSDSSQSSPSIADVIEQPVTREPETPPEPVISRQSIAVLPFENRSRNEDDEYFTEGIHDDLLTNLARIGSLKVISRTSVNRYKNTEKSIPEIAAELGVATIMEGAVQRSGTTVRINVQLIDAATDEHLWAEIYDRELTAANIFDIQSEIGLAIAEALRAELSDDEAQRLAMQPTQNLAAYEAWLLGRQRFARRSNSGMNDALVYFQQAIELDPDFSLAYVSLADVYQVQADWGLVTLTEANEKSLPLVEKALRLDGQSGEAYTTLASIRDYEGNFEAAEQGYRRALELAPNYTQAMAWFGLHWFAARGRPAEAVALLERALVLDPLSLNTRTNLADVYRALGDFQKSLETNIKTLEIDPTFSQAVTSISWDYWAVKGDLVTALDYALRGHAVDPDDQWAYAMIRELFSELGDDALVACALDAGDTYFQDSPQLDVQKSLLALYSNRPDDALAHARKSFDNFWAAGNKALPLAITQSHLQAIGDTDGALALYQEHFPDLLEPAHGEFNRNNYSAAIDLASLLQSMGRHAEAQQLLEGSDSYIQGIPRLGDLGYGINDVRILVLRGENEQALTSLRTAVDANWRYYWRYYLEYDSILDPLRGDPRFQAIVQEIRDDMATQLEQVRSKDLDQGICTG
jgi:TolB-like protein/cytochrome c-type biogenesis protein CcmH/NrfG